MKLYMNSYGIIFLVLNNKQSINVTFWNNNKLEENLCLYDIEAEKEKKYIDMYKITFSENLLNTLIETYKCIPNDIIENCKKCNFFPQCKYEQYSLKNYKETNKTLREFKNFIENISGIDKECNT